MKRMRTLLKYAIWIIAFFIFSEIMININLDTTYRNIGRKDNLKQITIYQAEATNVNARIKGTISNSAENKLEGKYLKIDFYSERDVLLGTKYIDIENVKENETQDLELYFKLQNVNYYNISFTAVKEQGELEILPKDLTREQVVWAAILAMFILW